LHESCGHGYRR